MRVYLSVSMSCPYDRLEATRYKDRYPGTLMPRIIECLIKIQEFSPNTNTVFFKIVLTAGLDCGPNNVIINSYRTTTKKHTRENEQIHTLGVNPGAICRLAAKHTVQLTVPLCACVCLCVRVCVCVCVCVCVRCNPP